MKYFQYLFLILLHSAQFILIADSCFRRLLVSQSHSSSVDRERIDVFLFTATEDGAAVDTGEHCGDHHACHDAWEDITIDELPWEDSGFCKGSE